MQGVFHCLSVGGCVSLSCGHISDKLCMYCDCLTERYVELGCVLTCQWSLSKVSVLYLGRSHYACALCPCDDNYRAVYTGQ
jgi:hypothetical protein